MSYLLEKQDIQNALSKMINHIDQIDFPLEPITNACDLMTQYGYLKWRGMISFQLTPELEQTFAKLLCAIEEARVSFLAFQSAFQEFEHNKDADYFDVFG